METTPISREKALDLVKEYEFWMREAEYFDDKSDIVWDRGHDEAADYYQQQAIEVTKLAQGIEKACYILGYSMSKLRAIAKGEDRQ